MMCRRTRTEVPPCGAFPLETDLTWADELDFSEVGDEITSELSPDAPRLRRIHDDCDAGFGEELGRVRERAVDDLAGRVRLRAVIDEFAAYLCVFDDSHANGLSQEHLGGVPRKGGLAAAR